MFNFGLTVPAATGSGAFNSYKPTEPIPTSLYGLLPQLHWYKGNACVPISITNALAGMAAWYETPELLLDGSDQHDALLNTFQSISKYAKTTNKGTFPFYAYTGLSEYFKDRGLEFNFAVQIEDNPAAHEARHSIAKSQRKYFQSLVSATARGPVIYIDSYTGGGAHALTGVSLEINDKNSNMIIDQGEAYAYVIDPLDPATRYSPETFSIAGATSDEEAFEIFNSSIQPAPQSTANLKKVEIFQDFSREDRYLRPEGKGLLTVKGGLTFNYDQTMVGFSQVEDKIYAPVISPSNLSEGSLYQFISIQNSSLPDDISDTISENASDNHVLYDLTSSLRADNQVEGTFFAYFNESSTFKNDLGFYQLADTSGSIVDPISGERLIPGDEGYLSTALELAAQFEDSDTNSADDDLSDRVSADQTQMGSFSFNLNAIDGKALLAPIVTTSEGNSWTTFASANLDGKNHFQSVGGLSFQMEDQFNLGDADYNDLQVILTPLEINGVS